MYLRHEKRWVLLIIRSMCTCVQVRAKTYIDFLDDFGQYYLKTRIHIVPTVFTSFLRALKFTTPLNLTLKIWVIYLVNLEFNPNFELMQVV